MGEADIQAETEVNRQIQKRYGTEFKNLKSRYFFSTPFHISLFFHLKCEIFCFGFSTSFFTVFWISAWFRIQLWSLYFVTEVLSTCLFLNCLLRFHSSGLIDLKTPIALPGRVQVKRFDHSLMRTWNSSKHELPVMCLMRGLTMWLTCWGWVYISGGTKSFAPWI